MTTSNKARRYLQNHKQHLSEPTSHLSVNNQFLIVDDSNSSMRKFRSKTHQIPIPQITVQKNNDDDEQQQQQQQGHMNLVNEIKHTSVLRTTSLNNNDENDYIQISLNQQRSFSFALGSKTDLHEDQDDDTESIDIAPSSKTVKLAASSKSSLSKERFSRLFHSLTFRSGSHLMSKISVKRTDSHSHQQQQHPCLACQNYPYLDLISKNTKKRSSIFGVLVNKINSTITNENQFVRCTVCKRPLAKSLFTHDDSNHHLQQQQQLLTNTKMIRDQKQLYTNIKRRQSLPSLFHNLLEPSSSSATVTATTTRHRPSFSSVFTCNQFENIKQSSVISPSTTSSLTESDDSNQDETTYVNDKFENDNEILPENYESHDLNSTHSCDSMLDNNPNQQFLHPPEEKPRNLLVNVFRSRRSNASLTSNETTMVAKQFSVSVLNLASSFGTSRRNSAIATTTEPTIEQRQHALSDENLPTMDNTYIYFTNINGQNFKEKLIYSTISENTTLKEMLIKIFEKHKLSIDTHHICLRSAPTLPLSLNQPVKHLLLNDLIVTESSNQVIMKTSAGKERNEKRNSTGSAILSPNSKSTSKRLSTHCMMIDNEENHRTNKTNRSSIFTSSIFARDSQESPDSNLTFIRRKCDEWLMHGLPKLAQLQCSIDECDLVIGKEWQPYLTDQARNTLSEMTKLQQETIYELFSTEVSYIRQILTMTDVFMTSVSILKSSQREGIFHDIDMDKLFSNIQEVLQGNLLFWKENFLPIKNQLIQTGLPMNPSDLKTGFLNFDIYFQPYLHYVLDQKTSAEYFKQKLARDELFQYLITWVEANFTNRLSFADLTIKPLQRLTRYKLLLEAIQKKTQDDQQRNDLNEMIQKVAKFVNRVNSKLHKQEQEERIRQIQESIGPYENISAPPELTAILQEYNRDSMSNRLDLLQDLPLHIRGYRRQLIQQGPMKMKDAKNNQDVYCYLFTDMFLITKASKRNTSTNSSSTLTNVDGQYLRSSTNMLNKILRLPIRIDRFDVKEYDRRTGNSEPNTASFVGLVFSEYNLIESAYLFQTNLSKQWIENIRQTKHKFQLLIEETKVKFQNLNQPLSPPTPICTSVSTNTIHHSLQSLNSPSMDLPVLKIENDLDQQRSSKIESDVFKSVEQTRRNSRIDRKNFGRYFTADGTSTHTTDSSPSSIKQISSSSTTILKRMSWNNDKTDSSIITNTNSFRSVHSSSGVSSTGSFLFSTDDDSAATSTSIPDIIPAENENQLDSTTFRRTPFTSIKKRSKQKSSSVNDHHSSTHTIINQLSKSIEETASPIASGNESDYDNHRQSPTISNPVNTRLNADELTLGDQNEITLPNDTHIDNQQSDSNDKDQRTTTIDETVQPNFHSYHRDPLITKRLLDIRSHLLMNTALDATEV